MNDIFDKIKKFTDKKSVAVLGFGISNRPLVRTLCSLMPPSCICVYDKKPLAELGDEASSLSALGVRFCTDFDSLCADIIFRSPGLRPDMPPIVRAVKAGATLTSEIEQVLSLTPSKTFALTGSDGKTTSTTLTGSFLERGRSHSCFVGGNIGTPLFNRLCDMSENDCLVLELSSFQLMHTSRSAQTVAITNITENHMNWHNDSMAEYISAKLSIVGDNTQRVVLNAENSITLAFAEELLVSSDKDVFLFSSKKESRDELPDTLQKAKLLYLKNGYITLDDTEQELPLLSLADIRLPGAHNIENYMTAIGMTYGYVPSSVYSEVARSFYGVEHRLEHTRTLDGVDYFNSSIDSSPTRTLSALSALRGRDIVIICGGCDKKLNYAPLADGLCGSVRAVVLTGETAPKIKAALLECSKYSVGNPEIYDEPSFEGAVARAAALGHSGGCVLLSPASTSFDRFSNFEERGRYFKELVARLGK